MSKNLELLKDLENKDIYTIYQDGLKLIVEYDKYSDTKYMIIEANTESLWHGHSCFYIPRSFDIKISEDKIERNKFSVCEELKDIDKINFVHFREKLDGYGALDEQIITIEYLKESRFCKAIISQKFYEDEDSTYLAFEKSEYVPFYLLVDDKNNNYEAYLVNDTDKEYFARQEYSQNILKPKSYLLIGSVKKDRDHPSITVWITDDTSETYLLSFNNLPYYCKEKVYSKYLKKQVYKILPWKLENCFHRVERIKIHDKYKDSLLDTLAWQQVKLLDVVNPDINKLINHLKAYLDIYQDYDVIHKFRDMQYLISNLKDLSIVEELEFGTSQILRKLKEMNINRNLFPNQEFLSFLDLSEQDKDSMLISVEIYGYSDDFTIDLIEYFKAQGFEISQSDEKQISRFDRTISYILKKDNKCLSIDSIYFEEVTYYAVLSKQEVQKYFLKYIKENKKNTYHLEYIKKDEKTPYQKQREFNDEYGW